MILLYKNKSDSQNSNNYRGIMLLSHTMKVWEKVVEMGGGGCDYFLEPVWICTKMLDYRSYSPSTGGTVWEKKERFTHGFIGLEKVYNKVRMEAL